MRGGGARWEDLLPPFKLRGDGLGEAEGSKGEIRLASLQVNEKWKESEYGNGDTYWYDEASGKTTWSDKSEG